MAGDRVIVVGEPGQQPKAVIRHSPFNRPYVQVRWCCAICERNITGLIRLGIHEQTPYAWHCGGLNAEPLMRSDQL